MRGFRRAWIAAVFVAVALAPTQPWAVPPFDGIDTVAPTVRIKTPASGDTVPRNTPINLEVTDNLLATTVEYYVDDRLLGSGLALLPGITWDTTTVANGSHTLRAKAYDLAGNVGTSAAVTVTVSNVDTAAPTAPGNLSASAPLPNRVVLSWTASSDNVGVVRYEVTRGASVIGSSTSTSYIDATVFGGTTYTYVVRAVDAAGNTSGPSNAATVTTPGTASSFTFAAAGDHGANARTEGSLAALDASGAAFYLALGDMDYNETASDAAWCDYVKDRLPTLGSEFPFQLVAGNHEDQGGSDGSILNHAACLPDRMSSTNRYAVEYSFDYPPAAPMVRVVMISPDLQVADESYDYTAGSAHYNWLASRLDDARAKAIPWTVVGMHKVCITAGSKSCEIGADLMNLLVSKKVDLVLHGHDHNYQRSKQLALNASTCPAVPVGLYDPECVVDSGADDAYLKGAGTLFLITGTFGRSPTSVSLADTEAAYFAEINGSSNGFTEFTVTAGSIQARYVNTMGAYTDAFRIG